MVEAIPASATLSLSLLPTTKVRPLFQLCTSFTIGNDARTSFWHDRWLDGEAPKDIAPVLGLEEEPLRSGCPHG